MRQFFFKFLITTHRILLFLPIPAHHTVSRSRLVLSWRLCWNRNIRRRASLWLTLLCLPSSFALCLCPPNVLVTDQNDFTMASCSQEDFLLTFAGDNLPRWALCMLFLPCFMPTGNLASISVLLHAAHDCLQHRPLGLRLVHQQRDTEVFCSARTFCCCWPLDKKAF